MSMLSNVGIITKRELSGYFLTPIAYVFIVIFLVLSGVFTFYLGGFFDQGQADLRTFFGFHPWLYLFLIPALTMRLWAEERKSGTIELLFTLPVTMTETVLGKFLATWIFAGVALALTFPIWLTVNYLGNPDNGVVVAGYIGSLLMAGAYIAIGSCISAFTKNQVIAFVITVVICLIFVLSGFPMVLDFLNGWLPGVILQAVSSFSFLTHFQAIQNGVVDVRDLIYFFSLIALWLFVNATVLEVKKAG
ncbi:MAG: ABC transporter permease [Arenicellales bacterium]